MKIVEINNEHKKFRINDYDNLIQDIESKFLAKRECLNNMELIHGKSSLLAYYIVYMIVSNNTLEPNINSPRNGLAFNDRLNNVDLGIYHAHLEDSNVLIWYIVKNEYSELLLKVKCIKHPQSYDTILKEIMKTTNGYDIVRKQYFKDYINNTYLKENKYVLLFKEFFNLK